MLELTQQVSLLFISPNLPSLAAISLKAAVHMHPHGLIMFTSFLMIISHYLVGIYHHYLANLYTIIDTVFIVTLLCTSVSIIYLLLFCCVLVVLSLSLSRVSS